MGAPFKRPIKILQLWIDCVLNSSEIDLLQDININRLRRRLQESQLYLEKNEEFRMPINRLPQSLKDGRDKLNIFASQDEIYWQLTNPIISVIRLKKFMEDWVANREMPDKRNQIVRRLVKAVQEGTWEENYKISYEDPIEIPTILEQYRFQFTKTMSPPKWFNSPRIRKQEYDAGFYPKKVIRSLKVQIEDAWKRKRGVIVFADPAHGKTTSALILQQKWRDEDENNICFRILSRDWNDAGYRYFEELFYEYADVNPKYRFIIVIEDIHLVGTKVEKIHSVLEKCTNVRVLMTSRFSAETQEEISTNELTEIVEVVPIPRGYNRELILHALKHYKINKTEHRTKIKSLISETQYKNILYTFSEMGRRFYIQDFKEASWGKRIATYISTSKRESRVLNSDYWHCVFFVLSVFRKYEMQVTKLDFYNGCKLYDSLIGPKDLGNTHEYLSKEGYLEETQNRSSTLYAMVFHPVIAENMVEILKETQNYAEKEKISELSILSNYLEGKGIDEFEAVKRKLQTNFNKLDLDFSKTLNSLKKHMEMNSYRGKRHVYHLLKEHPHFEGLIDHLYSIEDIQQFFLKLSSNTNRKIDDLGFEIIDYFDPKLSSIDCQEFLENLQLWRENYTEYGEADMTKAGGDRIKFLLERRPGFIFECQKYMSKLIIRGEADRYVDIISRIPKQELSNLDFKDVPLSFAISIYIKKHKYSLYHSVEYYGGISENEGVNTFAELSEIWNGPSYENIVQILFKSIVISIQNFDYKLVLHIPKNNVQTLVETQYELNMRFINSVRKESIIAKLQENYVFKPPIKVILENIGRFHTDFIERLILIRKEFRQYYKLIRKQEEYREIIRERLKLSLIVNEVKINVDGGTSWFFKPSKVAQILSDFGFDFGLLLRDISDREIEDEIGVFLLSQTTISELEEIMLANPIYDWELMINSVKELEAKSYEDVNYRNKKERLTQDDHEINQLFSRVYRKITQKELIESLKHKSQIHPGDLGFALQSLKKYGNKEDATLSFFIAVEKAMLDCFEGIDIKGFGEEELCVEEIWSSSLKFDISSEKKDIYAHCIEKFERFRPSPFFNAFLDYNREYLYKYFDPSLFSVVLFEQKRDLNELAKYLGNHEFIFEKLSPSKEDKEKLLKQLLMFNQYNLTDKVVSGFESIIKIMLGIKVIDIRDLQKHFDIDFYSRAYQSRSAEKRQDFLNFLIGFVLTKPSVLRLVKHIGINKIAADFLNSWKIIVKRENAYQSITFPHNTNNYAIDVYRQDVLYEIVFEDKLAENVIESIFHQIYFEYYRVEDRYNILWQLDSFFQKYGGNKEVIFRLHSELIGDKGDPFFIIDPSLIISGGHRIYEKNENNERLFDFLRDETQIRNRVRKSFESIVMSAYGMRQDTSYNTDFLFHLIVEIWGSLTKFSEKLDNWDNTSKEILYDMLNVEGNYFEDVKQIFEPSFRIYHERNLLLTILVDRDIKELLVFIEKYEEDSAELREIVEKTEMNDWYWDLYGRERDPIRLSLGSAYNKYLHQFGGSSMGLYMQKLLELEGMFSFEVRLLLQKMIQKTNSKHLYEILSVENEIREQFQTALITQIHVLSSPHLMKLLTLQNSEELTSHLSIELTRRLAEIEFNQFAFLQCLNYLLHCEHILEEQKEQKNQLGVVKLKRIITEYLKGVEEKKMSSILIAFQNLEITILTAYSLSQPNYLNHLRLGKEELEDLVHFLIWRCERYNLSNSMPYMQIIPEKKSESDGFERLNHFISPYKLWFFLDSYSELNLVLKLKETSSYSPLLKLFSQNFMEPKLQSDNLILIIEIIFTYPVLQHLRRYFNQIDVHSALTVIYDLFTVFIKSHELSTLKRAKNFPEEACQEFLELLAFGYLHVISYSTSYSTLRALKVLDEKFGQKVQADFIKTLHAHSRMNPDTPLQYLPYVETSSNQISLIKFIKKNLRVVYEFILKNMTYKDFIEWDSAFSRINYICHLEELWYLCQDEDWKEERKKLASFEFENVTKFEKQSLESETQYIFRLTLMCEYVKEEKSALIIHVKKALEQRKMEATTKKTDAEKEYLKQKEALSRNKEELRSLERNPPEKGALVYKYKDDIEWLRTRIEFQEKDIQSFKETHERVVEKKQLGGWEKEMYDYLEKWVECQENSTAMEE